jgi:hypothetical protein
MGKGSLAMGSNGGMMGSGIFGMVGSTVMCKAEDNSWFCSLSKLVSGLMMIIYLLFFVFIVIYLYRNRAFYYKVVFGSGGKK